MIITLDKWADQIANNVGKSNDLLFKSTLKDLIQQEYATLIKQTIDKNGYSNSLLSSIFMPLERVLNSPLEKTSKISLYVSRFKIKQPIRTNNSLKIFTFVGSEDGTVSFIPCSFEELNFVEYLPLVSGGIRYAYQNELIYVFSIVPINKTKITSVFADLTTVYEYTTDKKYTSLLSKPQEITVKQKTNIELDIPIDIINRINTKLLSEQFISSKQAEN